MNIKIKFIHIGKTGGSFFDHILRKIDIKNKIIFNSHNIMLDDNECKYIFFIRDPVSRYVSGFISRLRKGQPLYYREWSIYERQSFHFFKTPNELAEALSSSDQKIKEFAFKSMNSILHLRQDISYYVKKLANLKKFKNNILYIGRKETLNNDIKNIIKLLEYEYEIDNNDMESKFIHSTPYKYEEIKHLSELGKDNIIKYYEKDYEIIKYLDSNNMISK